MTEMAGKICKECGKVFEPDLKQRKYCSRECMTKATNRQAQIKWARLHPKIEITCKNCGKVFVGSKNRAFCCNECCAEYQKKMYRLHTKAIKERLAQITRTCPGCGKEFAPKSVRQYYCSLVCKRSCEEWNGKVEIEAPDFYKETHPDTCIRCSRPRAQGSELCAYHIAIEERRERKARMGVI